MNKKNVLLITAKKVIDLTTYSPSYIMQDRNLDARTKFPNQCAGPFGYVYKANRDGVYYIHVFTDIGVLLFAGPLEVGDDGNREFIERTFPDNFTMLCDTQVADAIVELMPDDIVRVDRLFSNETLYTS
jgi:hypothetical protein